MRTLADWACSLAGEAGEACNVIKKIHRVRDGIQRDPVALDDLQYHLAEELADTLIYLFLLAERSGVNLEAAAVNKFNNVSEKYDFPDRLPVGGDPILRRR